MMMIDMQYTQERQKLLSALDQAIDQGEWDSSLFYKNTLKQLLLLREGIAVELNSDSETLSTHSLQAKNDSWMEKQGYQKVYISLYQADGERIESWAMAIKSLAEHCVGRPVYRHVEHVQQLLRVKHSRSEGYVVIWVRDLDILPPNAGLRACDRFGNELLNLRAGSIQIENIIEFVHDDKVYSFVNKQLFPVN